MERLFEKMPWIMHTELPELARFKEKVSAILIDEWKRWEPPKSEFNFVIKSEHEFFNRLYNRFYFECMANFERFTLHPNNTRRALAYIQTAERSSPIWHDHIRTSTINGVYYLSVPDPSAEIWFSYLNKVVKVSPREGHLYLFPRWLMHRPMPQNSLEQRISVNVELLTIECPISRDGTRW